jgi:hypothetical protein
MAAELRQHGASAVVVDLECGLEEEWGDDAIGAGLRVDEHNEQQHPLTVATPLE